MKTILFAAGVIALAFSGAASAGPFVFSQSQNFGGQLSPFNTTLQFDQLDVDSLGLEPDEFIVVKAVNLFIDGTITANIAAENNNASPSPGFGANVAGNLVVNLASLSGSFNIFQAATSGGLAGSDGVPGSGPDFFDFGPLGDSGSDTDKILDDFGAFLGNGTVDADIFASGAFSITGGSNATVTVTNFQVNGTVRLDISYNIIPTPGAIALFGLAGLAAARRRRA